MYLEAESRLKHNGGNDLMILIEPGDDTHAFGGGVPDLPGCFSTETSLHFSLALTDTLSCLIAKKKIR
jgi:hypothetical protein